MCAFSSNVRARGLKHYPARQETYEKQEASRELIYLLQLAMKHNVHPGLNDLAVRGHRDKPSVRDVRETMQTGTLTTLEASKKYTHVASRRKPHLYSFFCNLISIVETFRRSFSWPSTSVPIEISLTVSFPSKKRRRATSTTSTALEMARPRAFKITSLLLGVRCMIIAVT